MKFVFLNTLLFLLFTNLQAQPYYRVDDPESKTCIFIDTFGHELPVGRHEKLSIAESFSEGLICINFKKSEKDKDAWGCLDAKGDTIIHGYYLDPFRFYNGVAKVSIARIPINMNNPDWEENHYCQYINRQGNLVHAKFFENEKSTVMDHTWAVTKLGAQWYILSKTGKLKELSVDYEYVEPFSDGLALCKRMNTYTVYIDTTGWPVVDITNENFTGDYENGFATYSTIESKYGFMNKKGQPVSPCIYDETGGFSEGMAAVKMYGKWGYIDEKGKLLIKVAYIEAHKFKEGLALVKSGDRWGFINKSGSIAIPYKFIEARHFNNGIASACDENNLWGFIDKRGNWIIKPQFISIDDFDEYGFATVLYTDKKSYKKGKLVNYEKALINKQGEVVWFSGQPLKIK